jgi:diaminopimelate decarboxylase
MISGLSIITNRKLVHCRISCVSGTTQATGRLSGGNDIIGNPADAKYGLTHEQIFEAYKIAKQKGATRFGLHSMMVSSEIRIEAHEETAKILFELAAKIEDQVGIEFEFINLGGGLGIPYNSWRASQSTQELLSKHYQGAV